MDETGLFYGQVPSFCLVPVTHIQVNGRVPPDQGLTDKRYLGVKGKKIRLTYAFTSNATGSEKLFPVIIGKAKKP
jgi:hypothetical protein